MSECPLEWIVLAALHLWQQQQCIKSKKADSPWLLGDGWRLNALPANCFSLIHEDQKFDVRINQQDGFIEAELNKKFYFVQVKQQRDNFIDAVVNNKPYQLNIKQEDQYIELKNEKSRQAIKIVDWADKPNKK